MIQETTVVKSSLLEFEDAFPSNEVKEECHAWMRVFLEDFESEKVRTCKIEKLYLEDVHSTKEELEAIQEVYNTLWSGKSWVGHLPRDWTRHSRSIRSLNLENPKYPEFIFKFCSSSPGRGVPAAHFLRVPKGKEIKQIINEENLDELEPVDESLIALKTQNEIQKINEHEQCYFFVVKSKKIDLLSENETISSLSSQPLRKQIKIASQIMRMICKSGLGDVGFHNFKINKKTGKLAIVDTEPLFGSLLLDEESKRSGQYDRNNEIKEFSPNSNIVAAGINNMIEASWQLPVFSKVAQIFQECFLQSEKTKLKNNLAIEKEISL